MPISGIEYTHCLDRTPVWIVKSGCLLVKITTFLHPSLLIKSFLGANINNSFVGGEYPISNNILTLTSARISLLLVHPAVLQATSTLKVAESADNHHTSYYLMAIWWICRTFRETKTHKTSGLRKKICLSTTCILTWLRPFFRTSLLVTSHEISALLLCFSWYPPLFLPAAYWFHIALGKPSHSIPKKNPLSDSCSWKQLMLKLHLDL